MRFLLVILSWVIIVGGLWLYIDKRHQPAPMTERAAPQQQETEQHFTLSLTPTFTVEKDPFALQVDGQSQESIELRINGSTIRLDSSKLSRGKALLLENIPGFVIGNNEIYVQASPPTTESFLNHGIRVQLLTEGSSIVDQTIWSEQGSLVAETIPVVLSTEEGNDHDH